jgi:hypothetical protein
LELTSLVEDLRAQVVELKRSMTLGQGVHAGGETFDSEDDIIVLMHKEGVNPKHLIGAAVDFISFFAHKKDGRIDDSKLSLEMKQMKMAGVDKIAPLRYIGAFRHKQPSHLLNSSNTEVKHGDRFPMFENKTAWHGDSLHKGANIELERTVTATAKQVDLYIEQYIPPGRIRDFCMRLCLDVTRWITKLIAYINRELKEVENYGIPESKVYTLMSNQLVTILNSMWSVHTMMQEFVSDSDLELCAVRAVMITMRVHMVQEDFANLEFKSHNLISSVFIRFLAEETGSNFASG